MPGGLAGWVASIGRLLKGAMVSLTLLAGGSTGLVSGWQAAHRQFLLAAIFTIVGALGTAFAPAAARALLFRAAVVARRRLLD